MLLKLDKNCSETILLLREELNTGMVVSNVVLPYPSREIDIIYLAERLVDGSSYSAVQLIKQEEYTLLDKTFIEHCLPCSFRSRDICRGGNHPLLSRTCNFHKEVAVPLGIERKKIRDRLEALKTTCVTMTIPDFFIIKSLDLSDSYSLNVEGEEKYIPSYHLSKRLDSGFEAIHATNIYSGESSYGKVCLGDDIVRTLGELGDILRCKTEQLLNGEIFYQLFFHSSVKNYDLTANDVFYHEFNLFDDFDEERGDLQNNFSYYTPAWFWQQAIDSWDTSEYSEYVCHMDEWQEAVEEGRCFCIDHSKHLAYLFDTTLVEDSRVLDRLQNVVFKAPILATGGSFLIAVVEKQN